MAENRPIPLSRFAFRELCKADLPRGALQAPPADNPPTFGFAPNGVYHQTNNTGGGSLYYSAGIDVTVKKFLDAILNLSLPWSAEAFLVDGMGTIMAKPGGAERLSSGLGELRIGDDHFLLAQAAEPVTGWQLTTLARKLAGRRLPIIAMTAHAMDGDQEMCLAAGRDGHIAKPILPGRLNAAQTRLFVDAQDRGRPTPSRDPCSNAA